MVMTPVFGSEVGAVASEQDVTRLLNRREGGQAEAADELWPLVYEGLHGLADRYFHGGQTVANAALLGRDPVPRSLLFSLEVAQANMNRKERVFSTETPPRRPIWLTALHAIQRRVYWQCGVAG